MTLEITTFDYSQLNAPISEFLQKKERNMREIVGKAYTDLGRELKEAQNVLASHNKYSGVFEKWYTALGFRRDAVYRMIHRFDVIANCEDMGQQELLEDLPVSLTYEIAAPSAESTEPKRRAKKAVLSGEVKTLKDYRELVKRLEQAEARAHKAEADYETVRDTLESIDEQPLRVEYVYV
ncbi:hypothetical protein [Paenibacillus vini]|uniref:Phage protein n=1 Tax=Paenibacillus vini TaxID=1476024 RepID=A0ABQ4MH12_9BACL|nr:hypothetical protein [Paenibacillus vini]GIP55273.1 hypothetical protein J42TS3_43080 [Paenibacillus vini]